MAYRQKHSSARWEPATELLGPCCKDFALQWCVANGNNCRVMSRSTKRSWAVLSTAGNAAGVPTNQSSSSLLRSNSPRGLGGFGCAMSRTLRAPACCLLLTTLWHREQACTRMVGLAMLIYLCTATYITRMCCPLRETQPMLQCPAFTGLPASSSVGFWGLTKDPWSRNTFRLISKSLLSALTDAVLAVEGSSFVDFSNRRSSLARLLCSI